MIDVERLQDKFAQEVIDEGYFYSESSSGSSVYFDECEIDGELLYLYGTYWSNAYRMNGTPFNVEFVFQTSVSGYSLEISISFRCRDEAGETNLLLTPDKELEYTDRYEQTRRKYALADESRFLNRAMMDLADCFRAKLLHIIEDGDEDEYDE